MFRRRRPGRLARLFLGVFLELGALAGLPMKPEEIQELLHLMVKPKVVHVLPDRTEPDGGRGPRRSASPSSERLRRPGRSPATTCSTRSRRSRPRATAAWGPTPRAS